MGKTTTTGTGPSPKPATSWLSMKDASELTGRTREFLKASVSAGELTARTIRRGDKVEYRLTRAALAEAGLIGAPPVIPEPTPEASPDTFAQLIGLIREQNQRIALLEDQRSQLAARLGATVEAMRQLEDRLAAVVEERAVPTPGVLPGGDAITTDDGLVLPRPWQATPDPGRDRQIVGVRRSLSRLIRDVAQPRLRELAGGPRREAAPGD